MLRTWGNAIAARVVREMRSCNARHVRPVRPAVHHDAEGAAFVVDVAHKVARIQVTAQRQSSQWQSGHGPRGGAFELQYLR